MTINRGMLGFRPVRIGGDPFDIRPPAEGGGTGGTLTVKRNSTVVGDASSINFAGAGIASVTAGAGGEITVTVPAAQNTMVVQSNGTEIAGSATTLNFGSGLTATAVGGVVTVSGAGGGGTGNVLSYVFRVDFSAAGAPVTVSNLPGGWTSSISGDLVTITHAVGGPPMGVSYFGRRVVAGQNRFAYRFATGTSEFYYVDATQTTQFTMTINSSVAAADVSGYANVYVVFKL